MAAFPFRKESPAPRSAPGLLPNTRSLKCTWSNLVYASIIGAVSLRAVLKSAEIQEVSQMIGTVVIQLPKLVRPTCTCLPSSLRVSLRIASRNWSQVHAFDHSVGG